MKYTILLIFILSSCSVVNKVFHKSKTRIDSTSTSLFTKSIVQQNDSFAVREHGEENEQEITIEFGQDTGIYIYPKNAGEYFEIIEGQVRTNKPLKKVTVKGKVKQFDYDSFAKHSKIDASETKLQEVKVSRKEKDVQKNVHKTRFNWWWLLALIPFIIYRYRKQIKAFVIHKITGL